MTIKEQAEELGVKNINRKTLKELKAEIEILKPAEEIDKVTTEDISKISEEVEQIKTKLAEKSKAMSELLIAFNKQNTIDVDLCDLVTKRQKDAQAGRKQALIDKRNILELLKGK